MLFDSRPLCHFAYTALPKEGTPAHLQVNVVSYPNLRWTSLSHAGDPTPCTCALWSAWAHKKEGYRQRGKASSYSLKDSKS